MPKFVEAFFQAPGQQGWSSIKESDLTPDRIAQCRSLDLRESPGGLVILAARNHKTTPHFYPVGSSRKLLGGDGGGEGEVHRKLCADIPNDLNKVEEIEVGFYDYENGDEFECLHTLKNYRWKQPGYLDVVKQRRYIPDILGRSPEIDLLDACPIVAIEVVDTHFNDLPTFKLLLEASERMPLFVAYVTCSEYPKKSQARGRTKESEIGRIRTRYYVRDGSFWVDGIRFEDGPSYKPTGKVDDYYYKIKDALTRLKFIRVSAPPVSGNSPTSA